MARLHVRLSDEEKEALEREAESQGINLSGIVRQALAHYLGWLEGQRVRNAKKPPPK